MRPGGRAGFLLLEAMAPRDRRALLLGAAVLLPALLWVLAVRPYRAALAEVRDRTEGERALLVRELELLASEGRLSSALAQAEAAADAVEDRVLRAPSLVLAEGELTRLLEEAASRSRVLLEEIRGGELARGEEPPPGLAVVRLHLRGESDMEGVLTFLDEMEGSPLLLRIRGLALEPQTARAWGEGGEGAAQRATPTGVVRFQVIVDGFAPPDGPPASGGAAR